MINHCLGNGEHHSADRSTIAKSQPQRSLPLAGELWASLIAAAGCSSKHKGQSSDHTLLFSSTNLPLFVQHIPLKWITWSIYFVLLKEEKKEDGCDFLRGGRKGLTTHLSFSTKLQSKSTHVPLAVRPPSLHLHRYFTSWELQPSSVPGPFAGRLGSYSSPPSSTHLSAVGTKAHRSRQLNQSTNWGGECAPTSLLKCISITQGGWKTIGFEEESWWRRKIVSYLRRMELSRCGQSMQRV